MGKHTTNMFRIVVYTVAVYLVSRRALRTLGLIILVSHLYKDVTHLERWPRWCDGVGFGIGAMLVHVGHRVRDPVAVTVGVMKMCAHVRQLVYADDQYYTLSVPTTRMTSVRKRTSPVTLRDLV